MKTSAIFLIFLIASVYCTGTLYVDTVFSSSESKITVDHLSGINASMNDTVSQNIQFTNFASLGISSPDIFLRGSYFSISTLNDATFTASNGDIDIYAGHNADINAETIKFSGQSVETRSAGDVLLLGRDYVSMSGGDSIFTIGKGGVDISSLAGPVSINTEQDLRFDSNDVLALRALRDLSTFSSGNQIVTADQMNMISENSLAVTSSTALLFVSSTSSVAFDSHDISATLGSLSATGNGGALLQSMGDELNVYGYLGVDVSSFNDIRVVGESGGATFISTGTEGVSIISNTGGATFTASGATKDSSVHFDATSIASSSTRYETFSRRTTEFSSGNTMAVNTDSIQLISRRDAYVSSDNKMTFSAGTSFGLTSNLVTLTAEDSVAMEGLLVSVSVGEAMSINSDGFSASAGSSGMVIAAGGDFIIDTSFTDGRDNELTFSSNKSTVSAGDTLMEGGSVTLSGGSITRFSSEEDLSLVANSQPQSSNIYFDASGRTLITADSWNQNAGDSVLIHDGPGGSASFVFGNEIVFQSTNNQNFEVDGGDFNLSSSTSTDFDVSRDFFINTQDDIDFDVLELSVSVSDIFANSDVFSSEAESLTLDAGRHVILSTQRNEFTDDPMSFTYASTILDAQNIILSSGGAGAFEAGQKIAVEATSIDISSGFASSVDLIAPNFDFLVGNDFLLNANTVTHEAGENISIDATTSFSVNAASHGIQMIAEESGIITTEDFTLSGSDDVFFATDAGSTILSDIISFNAPNVVSVEAEDELSFGAENISTVAHNTTLHSAFGTTLSSDDTTSFSVSDLFSMESNGAVMMESTVGPVLLTFDDFSFSAVDLELLSMSSTITCDEACMFRGGHIDMETSSGNISFLSAGSTNVASYPSPIGVEEFDQVVDGILLMAGSNVDISDTNTFFDSEGDLQVSSATAFTVDADTILFDSEVENQDIRIMSADEVSVVSLLSTTISSDGDYWMTATNGFLFVQDGFSVVSYDDFAVSSGAGAISVEASGTVSAGISLRAEGSISSITRDNTLQLEAMDVATFTSFNGITISSSGASESRLSPDGDSNSHAISDQLIGISMKTYLPESRIVLDSRESSIELTAAADLKLSTAADFRAESLLQQSYESEDTFTMYAEDGSILMQGADGIFLSGESEAVLSSYGFTTMNSKRDTLLQAVDLDVLSYHSDISVNSATASNIFMTAGATADFTASSIDMFAQANLEFTSAGDFRARGERGLFMEISGDVIEFLSESIGNTIQASEELQISSGGDLKLSNAGENMIFNGNGVIFTTTGGDMSYTAVFDQTATMESLLVNAFGTATSTRDAASFTAPDILFEATDSMLIDSTETMSLGQNTNPSLITLEGTGSDDFPGVDISSVGVITMTTDTDFSILAEEFHSFTVARTSLAAGQAFSISAISGDISFSTSLLNPSGDLVPGGIIRQNVAGALTHTGIETVSLISNRATRFSTGDLTLDAVAAPVTATALEDISNTIGGNLAVTATTSIEFEFGSAGEFIFNSQGIFTALSSGPLAISADNLVDFQYEGDATFTIAQSFEATSLGSSTFLLDSSSLFDLFVTLDTELNGASLDIMSSENNVILSTEGPFTLSSHILGFSTEGTFTVTSPAGQVNAKESVRIGSDRRNTIGSAATATASIDSASVSLVTLPGSFGNVSWRGSTSLDIASANSLFMDAGGGLSMDTELLDFDGIKLSIEARGERSNFRVDALDFQIISNDVLFAAGDKDHSGSMTVEQLAGTTTITAGTSINLFANPEDLASSSSIHLDVATQLLYTSPELKFSALSDAEGQQGSIEIIGSEISMTSLNTLISAEESSVFFDAIGSTLEIIFEDALYSTHGVDAGIYFESDQFRNNAETLSIQAGVNLDVSTSVLTAAATTATIGTLGPAVDGSYGVKILSNSEVEFSSGATTTLTASDSIHVEGTNGVLFESVDMTMTSDDILYHSKGVRINREIVDIPFQFPSSSYDAGIAFLGDTTTSINIVNDISVDASDDLIFSAPTLAVATQDSLSLRAHGNVVLDFSAIYTTSEAHFHAGEGGVSLEVGTSITTTGDFHVIAGILEEDSLITLTPGEENGSLTLTAAADVLFSSDHNFMQKTYSDYVVGSSGMVFEATKGDMLFRSIAIENSNLGPQDFIVSLFAENEINMFAFERIEHRQHERLAFFDTAALPGRSADAAPIQTTTQTSFAGNAIPNGCICTGGSCANVKCPDVTSRILQMQAAFIAYGLLDDIS